MTSSIEFIINMIRGYFNLLSALEFEMFGYQVTFLGVIFGFIILSFIISVFWKGAKT